MSLLRRVSRQSGAWGVVVVVLGGCSGGGSGSGGGGSAVGPVTVSVSPASVDLTFRQHQTFTATVGGTDNRAVTWTIGSQAVLPGAGVVAGGAIRSNGEYTAPSSEGTFRVYAASQADPTVSASATIVVRAPGPGGDTGGSVRVSVQPTGATVSAGAQLTLKATVSGDTNPDVTWSVVESAGGAVSAFGIYTAPTEPGTYHVQAASEADPTATAMATIAVVPGVAVAVTPSSATLLPGDQQQFEASVTGTGNRSVRWRVAESKGGTITDGGLYTASALAGTYHLLATSVAEPASFGSATVVVTTSIAIEPVSVTLEPGQSFSFTATVLGVANPAVSWSVVETGGGSVTQQGSYTAPRQRGTYHIKATSVVDSALASTATVVVEAGSLGVVIE